MVQKKLTAFIIG